MGRKYVVSLNRSERGQLAQATADADAPVRCRRRAQLLLDSDTDEGGTGLNDQAISLLRGVSVPTIIRVRQLFLKGGLEAVLALPPAAHPRSNQFTPQQIAHLQTLAASPPPPGSRRWSLRQLAEAMAAGQPGTTISHESVRRLLRAGAADAPDPEPAAA